MTTADNLLAPLIAMVKRHGDGLSLEQAHPGSDDSPACLIFSEPMDALEFLLHTAHHGAYSFGDNLALTIAPPLGAPARGKVSWLSQFTPDVTHIWQQAEQENQQ